jgi:hypothetical protein
METNRCTGPTTPAGKNASSKNAIKHGLRSKRFVVPEGQKEIFEEMHTEYTEAFLPHKATGAQIIIFENLFNDAWKIYRIEDYLDRPLGESRPDEPLQRFHDKDLLHMLPRLKSSFHKNLKLLKDLQTSQLLQTILPEPLDKQTVPPLAEVKSVVYLAKQTGKILAAIALKTISDQINKEVADREADDEA